MTNIIIFAMGVGVGRYEEGVYGFCGVDLDIVRLVLEAEL